MRIKEKLDQTTYTSLLHNSIVNWGNCRILSEKLALKHIKISALGGSITAGYVTNRYLPTNYVKLTKERLQRDKPNHFIQEYNLSVCGTACALGLFITESILTTILPDLVFVEYAVNEQKDSEGATRFESLIRKLNSLPSKPLIIIVLLFSEFGKSCDTYMSFIGQHYNLPVISTIPSLQAYIKQGTLDWSDYGSDDAHPSLDGHELIADCIDYLIQHAVQYSNQTNHLIQSQPWIASSYENLRLINLQATIKPSTDFVYETYSLFPFEHALSHIVNTQSDGITYQLQAKCCFLIYEQNNTLDYGTLEVFVDESFVQRLSGYSIFSWGNPITVKLFEFQEEGSHILQLKMAREDQSKQFHIIQIGVC